MGGLGRGGDGFFRISSRQVNVYSSMGSEGFEGMFDIATVLERVCWFDRGRRMFNKIRRAP